MTQQAFRKPRHGPSREVFRRPLGGDDHKTSVCAFCGRRANWREDGFGQEPYNINLHATNVCTFANTRRMLVEEVTWEAARASTGVSLFGFSCALSFRCTD